MSARSGTRSINLPSKKVMHHLRREEVPWLSCGLARCKKFNILKRKRIKPKHAPSSILCEGGHVWLGCLRWLENDLRVPTLGGSLTLKDICANLVEVLRGVTRIASELTTNEQQSLENNLIYWTFTLTIHFFLCLKHLDNSHRIRCWKL